MTQPPRTQQSRPRSGSSNDDEAYELFDEATDDASAFSATEDNGVRVTRGRRARQHESGAAEDVTVSVEVQASRPSPATSAAATTPTAVTAPETPASTSATASAKRPAAAEEAFAPQPLMKREPVNVEESIVTVVVSAPQPSVPSAVSPTPAATACSAAEQVMPALVVAGPTVHRVRSSG